MAVRVFKYTVTDDEIAAVSIPQAGVQGEHNATKLEFEMGDSLTQKLMALSGDGKVFCYHFDRYDGTGGKNSTEPIEFTPGADKNFSHLIEQWQTRYGGTIQIYFVITLVDEDKTEMELYSYSVKLMLKSLPEAAETDDENYDTVVTLAMVAKKHSEIATNAAKTATEAMERTELAKAALEGGSEWVFDGGDASDSIGVEFVVDSEFINGSENPVKSKVVKEYIDNGNKDLQEKITQNTNDLGEVENKANQIKDYVVETGRVAMENSTEGYWIYEKWASGKAICYGRKECGDIKIEAPWGILYESLPYEENYPDGLFVDTPYCFVEASGDVGVITEKYGRGTNIITPRVYFARPNLYTVKNAYIDFYVIGRWNKEGYYGFAK
jgi:hypothetical protein